MIEPFWLALLAIAVPIILVGALYAVAELVLARKRRRDALLTPLIGVVLPREEEK